MVWQRERRIFISSHPETRKQGLKCVCSFKGKKNRILKMKDVFWGRKPKGKFKCEFQKLFHLYL